MMRIFTITLFTFIFMMSTIQAIELIDRPTEGKQFQTLTFRFEENLNYENPFDLITNQVELEIIQPDFTRKTISFFYDGRASSGAEKWEARFAPKQAGLHRFVVKINSTIDSEFSIEIEKNTLEKQGGLVLSDQFGRFEFETGEAFRGIGLNVCWARDYEYYFKKMQAAGINFTRIWMCPWNLSFEWQDTGLGKYNLETAERLDHILELADQYGIFILLCMDYHGVARKGMGFFGENRWNVNPYNSANGGPCADAADLFTNNIAKVYFKKRYKYLVSRYGHSNNIAAWEFYNEADLMAGYAHPVNRWHIEMAEFVKSADAHERLVSTSGTRDFPEKVIEAFKSPAIDFVMYHRYNALNFAPYVTDLNETAIEFYQKPFILGEYGVEFRGGEHTYKVDPEHIGIHNANWAGFFNETPAIPLSWWWDNYIDRYDFWDEYTFLARFANELDFNGNRLAFKTLTVGMLKSDAEKPAPCMVRAIYTGADAAVWFKNNGYQWARLYEGSELNEVGVFTQVVPNMTPGNYTARWYNPQTGEWHDSQTHHKVKTDGKLVMDVPGFLRDMAVVVKRD